MGQWYYSVDGIQQGPVEDEEMRAMLASGMVQATTLVWKDGMEGWQPLNRQPEWASQIASPAGVPIPGYGAVPPTNGLAIASMVCGLTSLVLMLSCWMGVITGIPAVICGHMAAAQLKRSPLQRGKGFVITGLITGYLVIGITVASAIVFAVLIARDIR